jgi:hypothetical protein
MRLEELIALELMGYTMSDELWEEAIKEIFEEKNEEN